MKKTSKVFGALALSAALALGTAVPAFAAPEWNADKDVPKNTEADDLLTKETGTDDQSTGNRSLENGGDLATGNETTDQGKMTSERNTGSSKVRVLSDTGQLSATIPIMVYVVADTTGGDLLVTPTGTAPRTPADTSQMFQNYSGYRIENYSTTTAIRIADITVTEDSGTRWSYNADGTLVGKGAAAPTDGKIGYIRLNMSPNANTGSTVTLSGSSIAATLGAGSDWDIIKAVKQTYGGNEVTVPGVIGLQLGGQTSQIKDAEKITLANWSDAPSVDSSGSVSAGTETEASSADLKLIYTIDMAQTQS